MKIQRILSVVALFLPLFLVACAETGKEIEVSSIAISQPNAEMETGESLSLKATVSPSNATYDGLTWTSTNPKVATVSNSGLVTAIAEGNTTITVMAGGKTASCSITVLKGYVAVSLVSLNMTSLELVEGDTETLTATVLPDDATDKTVSWSSSNTGVATVQDGTITAVKEGEVVIIAKAGEKTASCKVSVQKKVIAVESIELNKNELSLFVGESETLIATVKPEDATYPSVSWTSSDEKVATVDNGIICAVSEGITTIEAKAGDQFATCSVSVNPIRVESISINKTELELYVGESEKLTVTVYPSNATNKEVSWGSDNPSVASITTDGYVTAHSPGVAQIMVYSKDSWKIAYCTVIVFADKYEAVDLGLSVKWSTVNYGASSFEQVGGYYVWGDPTGKAIATYTYNAPDLESISGTQYDIVRKNWGGKWRIPTHSEIFELYNNCSWTWITTNGVSGVRITGRNGNSIFIPASGFALPCDGPIGSTTIVNTNEAYLMSASSYKDDYGRFAYIHWFTQNWSVNSACYNASYAKFPIRPVR